MFTVCLLYVYCMFTVCLLYVYCSPMMAENELLGHERSHCFYATILVSQRRVKEHERAARAWNSGLSILPALWGQLLGLQTPAPLPASLQSARVEELTSQHSTLKTENLIGPHRSKYKYNIYIYTCQCVCIYIYTCQCVYLYIYIYMDHPDFKSHACSIQIYTEDPQTF